MPWNKLRTIDPCPLRRVRSEEIKTWVLVVLVFIAYSIWKGCS